MNDIIKTIPLNNFEDVYRENIQLQFNDDSQFIEFIKGLCNYGIDFQNTLITLSDNFQFNPNNFSEVNDENTFILNSIASFLNIPPITYFDQYLQKDLDGNYTSYDTYLLILNGQLAKNNFDGTNKGMLDILNSLFPQYLFILEDTGQMSITIYLVPLSGTISSEVENLFTQGYFTPKPVGVNVTLTVADEIYFAWDTDYVVGPPSLGKWDNSVWN